ncbi:hypothetical protein LV779_24945 [Streptomyces thinghirensis]|nr:hypothetical protein [Streptomyces thinghirensis]
MPLDPIAYQPYADPDDFIREVTDRIWVARDIDYIVENYEPDSIVHTSLGTVVGRDGVIEGSTMHGLGTRSRRAGRGRGVGGTRRRRRSSARTWSSPPTSTCRTAALCPSASARWPTASTAGAGWSRSGSSATISRTACSWGSTRTGRPRLRFQGLHRVDDRGRPKEVLRVGDSGERPDQFRPECEMVLEFIEDV